MLAPNKTFEILPPLPEESEKPEFFWHLLNDDCAATFLRLYDHGKTVKLHGAKDDDDAQLLVGPYKTRRAALHAGNIAWKAFVAFQTLWYASNNPIEQNYEIL